jgi:hypothetical protein
MEKEMQEWDSTTWDDYFEPVELGVKDISFEQYLLTEEEEGN